MRPRLRDPRQLDLAALLAAAPTPPPRPGTLNFGPSLRAQISRALKECPKSRVEIAAEMTTALFGDEGEGEITKAQLDGWTAPSHEAQGHRFPLEYLPALVNATGAFWLLDTLAEPCGCKVTPGPGAVVMKAGLLALQERAVARGKAELQKLVTPELLALVLEGLRGDEA